VYEEHQVKQHRDKEQMDVKKHCCW